MKPRKSSAGSDRAEETFGNDELAARYTLLPNTWLGKTYSMRLARALPNVVLHTLSFLHSIVNVTVSEPRSWYALEVDCSTGTETGLRLKCVRKLKKEENYTYRGDSVQLNDAWPRLYQCKRTELRLLRRMDCQSRARLKHRR